MTDAPEYNFRDLRLMAKDNTPARINLDRLLAESYGDQNALVEQAIDWCGLQVVENRHLKQDMSEDALTIEFVHMLKGMGFDADHDTQIGGHCDIVVRGRNDFLWIGESKIHKDYDWLLKGYEQLDSRYSTGQPGQDTGELLIFSYNERLDELIANWMAHLAKKRTDISIEVSQADALIHYSTHKHPGTGRPFRVRHKPINLFWKPTDKKSGASQAA